MTRKHYVMIAAAIREAQEGDPWQHPLAAEARAAIARDIARGIAGVLAQDNPRFDRDRFLTAALGDAHNGK